MGDPLTAYILQKNRKLVSTKPCYYVIVPASVPQNISRLHEQQVSLRVAKCVVYTFEIIEIQHQKCA